MRKTFGQFTKDRPEGALRAVRFPQMALLDQKTGDDREIASDGAGVRELPRTIFAQFAQSYGHDGSVPIGSLQEVTFEDDGNVTGRGWLADLAHVRDVFVPLIASKTLFHNSVDLAEVTVKIVWKSDDPADGEDFWTIDKILFTKSKIAATTVVGVPAFADARIALEDEVTAALIAGTDELELLLDMGEIRYRIEGFDDEITAAALIADAAATVPWADFHIPEAATQTKIQIDASGRVYGHVAAWGECHEGIEEAEGRCVFAPHPDTYDEYNLPSVLTERGMVGTGPIFFLGGHPDKPLGKGDRWRAYGGVENSWADVRVTNGVIGPWVSGRIRPGLSQEALYAARASRISGHWRTNGSLGAIVSCNYPAYGVGRDERVASFRLPDSELFADQDGAVIRDGEIVELVASLRGVDETPIEPPSTVQLNITLPNATAPFTITDEQFGGALTKSEMDGVIAQRRALATQALAAPETDDADLAEEAAALEVDEAEMLAIQLDLDDLELVD